MPFVAAALAIANSFTHNAESANILMTIRCHLKSYLFRLTHLPFSPSLFLLMSTTWISKQTPTLTLFNTPLRTGFMMILP